MIICSYDRAIFDTPELPLHCVLSGHTLTDVQEKLLNTNRLLPIPCDRRAATFKPVSVFGAAVLRHRAAGSDFGLAWFSELLESGAARNYTPRSSVSLALANMSQEHS
ncbi:hypothetical protein [Hominenteromicrobium sp.]|uniref:hypothetical protein n=1 Tax=Hominenteromicrobium sp. TaxID=3073581 RepID=UPI00399A2ED0